MTSCQWSFIIESQLSKLYKVFHCLYIDSIFDNLAVPVLRNFIADCLVSDAMYMISQLINFHFQMVQIELAVTSTPKSGIYLFPHSLTSRFRPTGVEVKT